MSRENKERWSVSEMSIDQQKTSLPVDFLSITLLEGVLLLIFYIIIDSNLKIFSSNVEIGKINGSYIIFVCMFTLNEN